jgi:hypothetical protein
VHVLMPRDSQKGFTLLEVLVAAVILIVAIVGSIALIVGLLKGNQATRARDTAYFIAQETLDQLASLPLSQDGALGMSNAAPTTPLCFTEGEDAFLDRPIACNAGTVAAYWVRSWICCATPVVGTSGVAGGLWNSPNLPPAQIPFACNGAGWEMPATIGNAAVAGVPATSASCSVAVEVTWPSEPTGTLANGSNLFVDTSNLAPTLTFQNHILESMVRSQ